MTELELKPRLSAFRARVLTFLPQCPHSVLIWWQQDGTQGILPSTSQLGGWAPWPVSFNFPLPLLVFSVSNK